MVLVAGYDRVGPVAEKECKLLLAEPPLSSSNMQIACEFAGHMTRKSAAERRDLSSPPYVLGAMCENLPAWQTLLRPALHEGCRRRGGDMGTSGTSSVALLAA